MEAFTKRGQVQVQGLDGPQELRIFYKGSKVEQKISSIDIISVKIQLYFKACTRNKNREGRYIK